MLKILFTGFLFSQGCLISAQIFSENFEVAPVNLNWQGDNCSVDPHFDNPFQNGQNPSSKVLRYHDTGGQYANINFTYPYGVELFVSQIFSFKIYVPSNGLSGTQNNQVSLKLQNSILDEPWTTQTEIIKNISLNTWQTVTFDFLNDNYLNFDQSSGAPINRKDYNRVLIQVNGENNNNQVLAYIDDFNFAGEAVPNYDFLVWNDEFEYNGPIEPSKWFHQTLLPNGTSWYNDEVQHYTNRIQNSFVENGKLTIVARKEPFTNQGVTKQFTSARLNSKFAFTYGKVEVRAKLPTGTGTWPAIWTLGKNINEPGAYWQTQGFGTTSWPSCGEMDIMEHWGNNQNYVQSATHTPSSFGATVNHGGQFVPTVSSEFHTYTMYWYPNKLVFLVDEKIHYVYYPNAQNSSTWPFNKPQYLILNIAIEPSVSSNFTLSSMPVEYVRIYQQISGLGLEETTQSEEELMEFYPNPAGEFGHLTVSEKLIGQEIQLYDIQGQCVFTKVIESEFTELNFNKLSSGMYFLKTKAGAILKIAISQ